MKIAESENVFQTMCLEAGLDNELPDFLQIWHVFQRFAEVPLQDEAPTEDWLVCSCSNSPVGKGSSLFCFRVSRQMAFVPISEQTPQERGSHPESLQEVSCAYYYQPQPGRDHAVTFESWSFGSRDEFFRFIEASEAFRLAARLKPLRFSIAQTPAADDQTA